MVQRCTPRFRTTYEAGAAYCPGARPLTPALRELGRVGIRQHTAPVQVVQSLHLVGV